MNSKYAKYSTEQLEVIFTHLADPDEKELVKKELSARYYQHYLSVSTASQTQAIDSQAPELSAGDAGVEPDLPALEDHPAQDEALDNLAEVAPIQLSAPTPPATAAEQATPNADKAAKKKYCFIATAAYGSPLAQEVVLLQNYRDAYLTGNLLGEKFIQVYYRFSPGLAQLISRHTLLKYVARLALTPLISLIQRVAAAQGRF